MVTLGFLSVVVIDVVFSLTLLSGVMAVMQSRLQTMNIRGTAFAELPVRWSRHFQASTTLDFGQARTAVDEWRSRLVWIR